MVSHRPRKRTWTNQTKGDQRRKNLGEKGPMNAVQHSPCAKSAARGGAQRSLRHHRRLQRSEVDGPARIAARQVLQLHVVVVACCCCCMLLLLHVVVVVVVVSFSQRKGPRLASCHWPIFFKHIRSIIIKAAGKPRHCGESTGKSDQDSVTKYHQFRSVAIVVDSNPAVADL